MTTLAHAAQAYVISKAISSSDEIAFANAVIATIPDVVSSWVWWREKNWSLYDRLHSLKNPFILLYPSWYLHNIVDLFTHDPLGGWYKWTYYIEAAWWLFFLQFTFNIF